MKPKVSIIIPIYNAEPYLERCLDSVIKQSLKALEIICVDDASSDNSCELVEAYIQQDPRISLIRHATNLGAGAARNTGICLARANYIAGVDSDDEIHPDMMKTLLEATENGKFDIVQCGFNPISEEGKEQNSHARPAQKVNRIEQDINIFTLLNPAYWNKLWKKTLFINNNIFFPEQDYYEDLSTTPRLVSCATHIRIIEETLYNYRIRAGAITTTFSEKHIIDYFKGFDILIAYFDRESLLEKYKKQLYDYIHRNIAYHSRCLLDSTLDDKKIEQYLAQLLLFKTSYIENKALVTNKSKNELLALINDFEVQGIYRSKADKLTVDLQSLNKIVTETKNNEEIINKNNQQLQQELKKLRENNLDIQKSLTEAKTKGKEAQSALIEQQSNITLLEAHNKQLQKNAQILEKSIRHETEVNRLKTEQENRLNFLQEMAVFLFGLLLWPFMQPSKYKKLKDHPKAFFRDSKSKFTILISHLIKLY